MPYLSYTPLSPKGETSPEKWPVRRLFGECPDDAIVCLTEPFMKHYAGTLFSLGKLVCRTEMDEHPINTEKQSSGQQAVYRLPDNGRGPAVELPESSTICLPASMTGDMPVFEGPCRITSLECYLQQPNQPTTSTYPVPDGSWPVKLTHSSKGIKTVFEFDSLPGQARYAINIEDRQTSEVVFSLQQTGENGRFDAGFLKPGFYRMTLDAGSFCLVSLTFIRLFPFYAQPDGRGGLHFLKTIW